MSRKFTSKSHIFFGSRLRSDVVDQEVGEDNKDNRIQNNTSLGFVACGTRTVRIS